MGISVSYNKIGKWVAVDWRVIQNFYGVDFNPTVPSRPSEWDSVSAVDETTSFNLSWFQVWNEVFCSVFKLESTDNYENYLYWGFEMYYNNTWLETTYVWFDLAIARDGYRWWYSYFWVDSDEIWPSSSRYRVHYYTSDWVIDFYSPEITVSNLSFNTRFRDCGYLRVEWKNLCYTDGAQSTWGDGGYKHRIAYDSSFSESSAWDPWYIRLESDDILRIYYIDEYWTKRRTYSSDSWYGWNVNVWSSKAWYIRASDAAYADDWYRYLCFIAPNWSKRRIMNWPPEWYA